VTIRYESIHLATKSLDLPLEKVNIEDYVHSIEWINFLDDNKIDHRSYDTDREDLSELFRTVSKAVQEDVTAPCLIYSEVLYETKMQTLSEYKWCKNPEDFPLEKYLELLNV